MYDQDYILEGWVENELRKKVFPIYDPTDRREIEYDQLAEVLTDVKHILDKNVGFVTINSATIEMLKMLKGMGIVEDSQMNDAYHLDVIKQDEITGQEKVKEKDIYLFTDNVRWMYEKMQDTDFVSQLPLAENDYFEKFKLEQVNI